MKFSIELSGLLSVVLLLFAASVWAQRDTEFSSVQQYTVGGGTSYSSRMSVIDDTHFITVWKETSSSATDMYGRIGEVDTATMTITYGSQFLLVSASCRYPEVVALSSTQAVIFYEADLTADRCSSQVVTFDLSTDNITSVGSATAFSPGDVRAASSGGIRAEKLSSSTFIVTYLDSENSNQGVARIGTVSGTSVSFGQEYVFDASNAQYQDIAVVNTDTVIVAWEDDGTSFDPGVARVGSISGTTITWGATTYTFHSSTSTSATRYTAIAPLSDNKFAIAWSDDAASDFAKTLVGTRTGTTLSFGATHTVDNTQDCRDLTVGQLYEDEYIIAYNGGAGDSSRTVVCSYNGSTIDIGDHKTFLQGEGDESRLGILNNNTGVVVYIDETNTDDKGEAVIVKTTTQAVVSTPVSASITAQTNVACNGASTGSLTATATDGTANFSYVWSNGSSTNNTASTTNTLNGLAAGTYTVTITDNNGTTSTANTTVTEAAALSAGSVQTN